MGYSFDCDIGVGMNSANANCIYPRACILAVVVDTNVFLVSFYKRSYLIGGKKHQNDRYWKQIPQCYWIL